MPEILLLRLEGPLQSWGIRARWDVRDTETEPTKSGIVGLLGCALGYPSNDARLENELDAGFAFGVRIEAPGRVIQDYQTVTDFLPTAAGGWKHSGLSVGTSLERIRDNSEATPATIVTPRYYLEDAAFLVALQEWPAFIGLAHRCAEALRRPRWPLFLGRKSCVPTRPVLDEVTDRYDDLDTALRVHPWSWLGSAVKPRRSSPTKLVAFVEDVATGTSLRRDGLQVNSARQYGYRNYRRLPVDLLGSSPEGDN